MSEVLVLSYTTPEPVNTDANTIYVLYAPTNMVDEFTPLSDFVGEGHDCPVVTTIQDAIDAYMPTARANIFAVVEEMFPGQFEL